MELVPVGPRSQEFAEVWAIYESSFPADERRTLEQQEAISGNPFYELLAARANGKVEGFISAWKLPGFRFIEHFAVHEGSRGRGLGREMLASFMSGKEKIIIEAEKPSTPIQKRRIAFYQKAGFVKNAFDYIQPPYGPGKNPVHMLILSYPGALSESDFLSARVTIHHLVYGLENPLV